MLTIRFGFLTRIVLAARMCHKLGLIFAPIIRSHSVQKNYSIEVITIKVDSWGTVG